MNPMSCHYFCLCIFMNLTIHIRKNWFIFFWNEMKCRQSLFLSHSFIIEFYCIKLYILSIHSWWWSFLLMFPTWNRTLIDQDSADHGKDTYHIIFFSGFLLSNVHAMIMWLHDDQDDGGGGLNDKFFPLHWLFSQHTETVFWYWRKIILFYQPPMEENIFYSILPTGGNRNFFLFCFLFLFIISHLYSLFLYMCATIVILVVCEVVVMPKWISKHTGFL